LPRPKQVRTEPTKSYDFAKVFRSFLDQPRIGVIITYILIFRLGDALLLKMAQPFLLDPVNKGGLAITTADVGVIYGTVGILTFLAGGLIGGWLVSKYGLKRCLLPTAIIQNGAILLYWILAILRPATTVVAFANALEQFAYGFGTAAYTVFLLRVVKEEYKAAHYAMASAIMALGLLIPGMVSGKLEDMLGYREFFLVSFFCSIPGMFCIPFLPFNQTENKS
jgi:MFS transporter, PAT family, beta-lactamase induction signal transducer AmpG